MNRPYGPEAVRGMDELYEAAAARSDRTRKRRGMNGISDERVKELAEEVRVIVDEADAYAKRYVEAVYRSRRLPPEITESKWRGALKHHMYRRMPTAFVDWLLGVKR